MKNVSPEDTIRAFLNAMEKRDLAAAKALLAPEFAMEFPGGGKMHSLKELIDWAKPRYRSVGKRYERFDVSDAPDGSTIVYCFGTLEGVWNDGTSFSGIRFIDRFSVVDGKITDQKVWNDLGEVTSR
jgi:limonene-1,2-epoxide hydrolase